MAEPLPVDSTSYADDDLRASLEIVFDRLLQASRSDAELRAALQTVAGLVYAGTGSVSNDANASSLRSVPKSAQTELADQAGREPPPVARLKSAVDTPKRRSDAGSVSGSSAIAPRPALPPPTVGQGAGPCAASGVEYPSQYAPVESLGARVDLSLVQRRLRMKAEGARWAAERRRLLAREADYAQYIEPNDREVIRRAKEIPGCYLWTNGPNSPMPRDLEAFEVLARCYDNAAASVGIVVALDEVGVADSDTRKHAAFQLLAEAQSALRVAAVNAGGPEDSDQFEVFQWLKANTRDREIYVARHMRVNDPAVPLAWQSLAQRLDLFDSEMREAVSGSATKETTGQSSA